MPEANIAQRINDILRLVAFVQVGDGVLRDEDTLGRGPNLPLGSAVGVLAGVVLVGHGRRRIGRQSGIVTTAAKRRRP